MTEYNPMRDIGPLLGITMTMFDMTIAIFDEIGLSRIEKGVVKLARKKLYGKIQSAFFEHKTRAVLDVVAFAKENLPRAEAHVTSLLKHHLPQRVLIKGVYWDKSAIPED